MKATFTLFVLKIELRCLIVQILLLFNIRRRFYFQVKYSGLEVVFSRPSFIERIRFGRLIYKKRFCDLEGAIITHQTSLNNATDKCTLREK